MLFTVLVFVAFIKMNVSSDFVDNFFEDSGSEVDDSDADVTFLPLGEDSDDSGK